MLPVIAGGLIDAGASLLGGLFGMHSARKANETNLALQRQQQQWEQTMSNTAVSRRADDIEAAGGNRALAFTNGQEATTPSVLAGHVEPEGGAMSDALSSVGTRLLARQMAAQQIKASNANIDLTKAQTQAALIGARNTSVDTMLKLSTGMKTDEETQNLISARKEIEARAAQILTETKARQLELDIKGATKQDLIDMAHSEAQAAKYGVSKKEWESLLYGVLNKWFGTSQPGAGGSPPKPTYGGIERTLPSQRHGTIKR